MDVQKLLQQLHNGEARSVARAVSLVENQDSAGPEIVAGLDRSRIDASLVLGITGPPGAGKSTGCAAIARSAIHGA